MVKTCTKCGETKPTGEFGKHARGRDGLNSQCKPCVAAASAAWSFSNPEKVKSIGAAYRAANREKLSAYEKARRAANTEKSKSIRAAYYAANREKEAATSAAWRKANPEACRIIHHNRRARKRANGGKLSAGLVERLFILQRGKCACCGKKLGDDYHLDHIMPLALGGVNEDWNIQLLTQRCNNQKYAAHPIDFMQSRGFLL